MAPRTGEHGYLHHPRRGLGLRRRSARVLQLQGGAILSLAGLFVLDSEKDLLTCAKNAFALGRSVRFRLLRVLVLSENQ